MASMREVAAAAGVSVATVSHVLSGTKRVTPAVSARVRAAAEALGYVPNRQASALRTGRTDILGVLLPDLSNPFFPALLNAVEVAARGAGFHVLVCDTENDPEVEANALERLAGLRVDGLVWVPAVDAGSGRAARAPYLPAKAQRRELKLPDVPLVALDRPVADRDAVFADHVSGGALVAGHLKELGRRRVGLLHGATSIASARARRRGFLAEFDPLVPVWEAQSGFGHDLPGAVVRRLRAGGFDAVVCANDAVAVGVIRTLRQIGASVPEDVAVVGFDDIPWARLMDPPLTTVRQPLAAIGAAAVRLLLERTADPGRAARQVVLPVELVPRGSTATVTGAAAGAAPALGPEPDVREADGFPDAQASARRQEGRMTSA